MAKYDGLIIPRSYNDYVNKSDPIGVSQALALTGVMDNAPTAQSTKPAKSGGIFAANAVIMANNKTLSGVAISAGSVVRVMFTAALTGSDAETGLTLTYNGNAYAVKVGKNGALVALTAHLIEESYVYLQAYTTLELAFDGSQFVVMGNPVVISNNDFNIMADGSITQHNRHLYKYSVSGTLTFEFFKPTEDYIINKYFLVNAVNALDGYTYPYYSLISIGRGDNNELYCKASNIVNDCVNNVSVRYDSNTNKVFVTVETGKTRTSVASLCDIAIY